ncbi:MAG: acetylornithine transaminase [Armatimonadota bacterium]|nr:acetylornithine transaminase [Armatimonadota bacterium]
MDYDKIVGTYRQYVMDTYGGRQPISLARGAGVEVWDTTGKRYLDFLAGIAVNGLGHCHPGVVNAIREQAGILMHVSNLYYTESQARLAKMLVEWSEMDKAFFCNSGAEANEAAIKLARKWGKSKGSDQKFEIVTALESFHGRTMGAITATGQPKYQKSFEPLVPGFKYVPYNDVEALRSTVTDATCAVLLEPIQGESGVHPASKEYLAAARKACDEVGALLIFDEVQTGLGRTGRMFAYEHYGVAPDVMTLAKTLGGGFPIGACLARDAAAEVFQPGDHASTFGGNPLACAAGIAAMTALHEEALVENARDVGEYFASKLRTFKSKRDDVIEVRGMGLLLGIEFATPVARTIAGQCLELGLIVNAIGDRIIRFLPPLVVTRKHVDEAMSILAEAAGAL